MKKTAEKWRVTAATKNSWKRDRPDQILSCTKESLFVWKIFAEGFRRSHSFYFIFVVIFPGGRSVNVVGQRRDSLFFSTFASHRLSM